MENRKITSSLVPINEEDVKYEIMSVFQRRIANDSNCASIVISNEMLPFKPLSYNIRNYLDSKMIADIAKAGFEYSKTSSGDFQLVFILRETNNIFSL